jgi:pimeloyl-ACP methyl ester carboxylesterase
MKRDTLYLLPPGFEDRGERQYCPECAEIWGLLAYYPALKETINIVYETLAHPRDDLVAHLGPGQWNCPTLILSGARDDIIDMKVSDGHAYLDNANAIARYWAARYGTALPR